MAQENGSSTEGKACCYMIGHSYLPLDRAERMSLSLTTVIPLTPMLIASSYLKSCAASFLAKHEISRKQRRFTDYTLLPSASLLIRSNS